MIEPGRIDASDNEDRNLGSVFSLWAFELNN
jgi:hypothetical protein